MRRFISIFIFVIVCLNINSQEAHDFYKGYIYDNYARWLGSSPSRMERKLPKTFLLSAYYLEYIQSMYNSDGDAADSALTSFNSISGTSYTSLPYSMDTGAVSQQVLTLSIQTNDTITQFRTEIDSIDSTVTVFITVFNDTLADYPLTEGILDTIYKHDTLAYSYTDDTLAYYVLSSIFLDSISDLRTTIEGLDYLDADTLSYYWNRNLTNDSINAKVTRAVDISANQIGIGETTNILTGNDSLLWQNGGAYVTGNVYINGDTAIARDTLQYYFKLGGDTIGVDDSIRVGDSWFKASDLCRLQVNVSKDNDITADNSIVTLTAYVNQEGISYSWDGGSGTNRTYQVLSEGTYECVVSKSGCVNDTAEIFVHAMDFKDDYNFELPPVSGNDTVLTNNYHPGVGGEVDTAGLPVINQIAYFTAANKIGGSSDLTWDGDVFNINGDITIPDNDSLKVGGGRVYGSNANMTLSQWSGTYFTDMTMYSNTPRVQLRSLVDITNYSALTIDEDRFEFSMQVAGSGNSVLFTEKNANFYSNVVIEDDVTNFDHGVGISDTLNVTGSVTLGDQESDTVIMNGLTKTADPYFYGACADSSSSIDITQNVYSQITNSGNNLITEYENEGGFTFQGDSVQIPVTGRYSMMFKYDFEGPASAVRFNGKFSVNGTVIQNRGGFSRTTSTSAQVGSTAMEMTYNFTANDWIRPVVTNVTGSQDLNSVNIDWTIKWDE